MEEFNRNIDAVRGMMQNLKIEKYAIRNVETADLDNYRKSLYLRILCSLIQYENEPSDMQVLLLRRIVDGISVEEKCEDYMRRALNLSDSDMKEFLSLFAGHRAKYYFALDGLLLVSLGKSANGCEYLAQIIELLDITKGDLEYLCMVARSVLLQQSSCFDTAKKMVNERTKGLNFTSYIRNFYVGAIVDTDTEKYYSAPDKKLSVRLKLPDKFRERKLVFKNLRITLHSNINFEGCEDISFIDCELIADGGILGFSSVGRLSFQRCKASGFQNHVAYMESINHFEVENCEFLECGFTGPGSQHGGVFVIDHTIKIDGLKLVGNQLRNCYVAAETYDHYRKVTGVFLGFGSSSVRVKNAVIKNNLFVGCRCIHNNNGRYTAAMIETFYTDNLQQGNNRSTGKVTRIFESDQMELFRCCPSVKDLPEIGRQA